MKKLLFVLLTTLVNFSSFAEGPFIWEEYDKTVSVKGGPGIEQFVTAIFDCTIDSWNEGGDCVLDKRNGFFHFRQNGGLLEHYVSYWNRQDGKKLVLLSYCCKSYGNTDTTVLASPWGYRAFSKARIATSPNDGYLTEVGFFAYLYDAAKKQLVPLKEPPFNGFENPMKELFLLQLPQKGKDIEVVLQTDFAEEYAIHTLKWNGMTFDFVL